MVDYATLYKAADFKTEKHAPVIEVAGPVKKGQKTVVNVSVGKEIAHPNKTEHHIAWIDLYFFPDGEKFPYQIGKVEFTAHGASATGPDTSTIYAEPAAHFVFKTDKAGTLIAESYCNIHGLWKSELSVKVE